MTHNDRLKEQIDEIVELKMKKYPIRAISAGLPWGINNGTILFGAKSYGLEGYNLQEHLEEKFGVSARVENDMNTIVTGCYNRMFTDEKVSIACVNFGNRGFVFGWSFGAWHQWICRRAALPSYEPRG